MKAILKNSINFNYMGDKYQGLMFFKSIKRSKTYYDELIDGDETITKSICEASLREEQLEKIHIFVSWGIVFLPLSILILLTSLGISMSQNYILSLSLLCTSFIFYLLGNRCFSKAKKQKILGLDTVEIFTDMMFTILKNN